jgi:hypothetical protein
MNALPKATMTLDDLKLDYATASTEQQKALICRQAWDLVLSGPHGKVEARDWLAKEFPDLGSYQHELRLIVLNNPNASVLWDRIDGPEKMLVGTACSLLRKARKQGKSLAEVLAEYDTLPWKYQADGTKFRCASAGRHSQKKTAAPAPDSGAHTLSSWDEFRVFGKRLVEEQLAGENFNDFDRSILWKQVDVIMAQALAEVKFEVQKLRSRAKYAHLLIRETTPRSRVIEACRALVMSPPKVGQPADLKKARQQKRALARSYHPDSNAGVVNLSGFQQTIEAYDTLVEYNKQFNQENA